MREIQRAPSAARGVGTKGGADDLLGMRFASFIRHRASIEGPITFEAFVRQRRHIVGVIGIAFLCEFEIITGTIAIGIGVERIS